MRIYNRAFDDGKNDFQTMWYFLIDDYADKKDQFIWTIGRLGDWKYGVWNEQKCFPNFMRKNAQLWFNNLEELVGFVIAEDCDNRFTIFTKRGYEILYSEMIKWVKCNWSSREGDLITEVPERYIEYIKELEKEGFKLDKPACITRQYNVCDKANEPIRLDSNFVIQDMLVNPDLKGKTLLYNNAWRNQDTVTEFDLLKCEYNRENPCFNPKFDLSIVDENGFHVSACAAFIDYKNSYAEIEKICTHSSYRGKGLAEAVVRECFKRLHSEGIQDAYITGYGEIAKNLYGKLGAIKDRTWFYYTLAKE